MVHPFATWIGVIPQDNLGINADSSGLIVLFVFGTFEQIGVLWASVVGHPAIAIMTGKTYVDMVKAACDAIGGKAFGGKFASRAQIKKHLAENFGYTDNGSAKVALKSALAKMEKKGDSFRVSKAQREADKEAAKPKKKKAAKKKTSKKPKKKTSKKKAAKKTSKKKAAKKTTKKTSKK